LNEFTEKQDQTWLVFLNYISHVHQKIDMVIPNSIHILKIGGIQKPAASLYFPTCYILLQYK